MVAVVGGAMLVLALVSGFGSEARVSRCVVVSLQEWTFRVEAQNSPVVTGNWRGHPFEVRGKHNMYGTLVEVGAVPLAGAGLLLIGCGVFVARRRLRVGECAACGYDRRGLGAGAICPECGAGAALAA